MGAFCPSLSIEKEVTLFSQIILSIELGKI